MVDVIDKQKTKDEFKVQVLETFATLITAAFGLVAALAWNEAIKKAIASVFSSDGELIGLFIYAIVVTSVAIIFTILIANSLKKAKAKIVKEE
ncbi:MAG: DUF5654 family protein [Candidatus Methanomethylophilaceae archaeon]|jgi:hypothetical protein